MPGCYFRGFPLRLAESTPTERAESIRPDAKQSKGRLRQEMQLEVTEAGPRRRDEDLRPLLQGHVLVRPHLYRKTIAGMRTLELRRLPRAPGSKSRIYCFRRSRLGSSARCRMKTEGHVCGTVCSILGDPSSS
jgi:hypothetical protein